MEEIINNEFNEILALDYFGLISFLHEKYGKVQGSYFLTEKCASPNKKIKRSSEGLQIHHVGEYKYENLSQKEVALRYLGMSSSQKI